MVNTKRLQCDKSFESEDFDDEESEENDENQPPGATTDVRPRDYGKVIALQRISCSIKSQWKKYPVVCFISSTLNPSLGNI